MYASHKIICQQMCYLKYREVEFQLEVQVNNNHLIQPRSQGFSHPFKGKALGTRLHLIMSAKFL